MKLNKLILFTVVVFSCAIVKASGGIESYDMSPKAAAIRNLVLGGAIGVMAVSGLYTYITQNNLGHCFECKGFYNDRDCVCFNKNVTRHTRRLTFFSGKIILTTLGISGLLILKNFML